MSLPESHVVALTGLLGLSLLLMAAALLRSGVLSSIYLAEGLNPSSLGGIQCPQKFSFELYFLFTLPSLRILFNLSKEARECFFQVF